MRTSRPFSTISYNTTSFLRARLDDLVSRSVLDFWVFVEHQPEVDETKPHKHLFCIPSRQIDTGAFSEHLKEILPSDPLSKPLGCMPCRASKFDDWYLYAIHDAAYLAGKGQSRRLHYTIDDFVSSCDDYFLELRHQIDYSRQNLQFKIAEAVYAGETFSSLVSSGLVPLTLIGQAEKFYSVLVSDRLERACRKNHESEDESEVDTSNLI